MLACCQTTSTFYWLAAHKDDASNIIISAQRSETRALFSPRQGSPASGRAHRPSVVWAPVPVLSTDSGLVNNHRRNSKTHQARLVLAQGFVPASPPGGSSRRSSSAGLAAAAASSLPPSLIRTPCARRRSEAPLLLSASSSRQSAPDHCPRGLESLQEGAAVLSWAFLPPPAAGCRPPPSPSPDPRTAPPNTHFDHSQLTREFAAADEASYFCCRRERQGRCMVFSIFLQASTLRSHTKPPHS